MNAISQTLAKMEAISDKLQQWALHTDFLDRLDEFPLYVAVLNEEGRIEAINQAFGSMIGYSKKELYKKPFVHLIPEGRRDTFEKFQKKFFESPFKYNGEYDLQIKGDSTIGLLLSLSSLEIKGEPKQIALSIKVEQQLEEGQSKLSELDDFNEKLREEIKQAYIEIACHEEEVSGKKGDLKLQLHHIQTLVEVLLKNQQGQEVRQHLLTSVAHATENALKQTEKKEQLDLLESGEYTLELEELDLLEVIEEVHESFKGLFEAKKLRLLIESDNPKQVDGKSLPYVIYADRFYINLLISHLLQNAAEASPEHQTILVHIATASMSLEISVHNWGTIDEELKKHFFEKYVTKGKKKGTGLGTYICKMIARAHKGMITMRSSEENGTYVVVAFPTFHAKQSKYVA